MSDLKNFLLLPLFVVGFLTMILWVVFGQLTVRRLRQKPETKERLGIEFVSGMNIMGIAQMLSLPRSWARALDKKPNSFLMANSEALYKNTTVVDRVLARTFYYSTALTVLLVAILIVLDKSGSQ